MFLLLLLVQLCCILLICPQSFVCVLFVTQNTTVTVVSGEHGCIRFFLAGFAMLDLYRFFCSLVCVATRILS